MLAPLSARLQDLVRRQLNRADALGSPLTNNRVVKAGRAIALTRHSDSDYFFTPNPASGNSPPACLPICSCICANSFFDCSR